MESRSVVFSVCRKKLIVRVGQGVTEGIVLGRKGRSGKGERKVWHVHEGMGLFEEYGESGEE